CHPTTISSAIRKKSSGVSLGRLHSSNRRRKSYSEQRAFLPECMFLRLAAVPETSRCSLAGWFPNGSVLGIEPHADTAYLAAARVAVVCNVNARFEVGNIESYAPSRLYDALIGRFVLPYLSDPSTTLRHLASYLNPGAVIAFMEFDVTKLGSVPESLLVRKICE